MYAEIIRQIQELNQKLVEQEIYAGGKDFYKVLENMPFPDKRNVFLAVGLSKQQQYLIEFAPPELSPVDLQKYLRRALFLMALDSERGIITAHDFSMDTSRSFVILDWVPGHNLAGILRHEKLQLKEALWIISDLTQALEHLAEFNFVHRSINPGNITIQKETGRAFLGGVEHLNLSDLISTSLDVYDYYASPELIASLLHPEKPVLITPWSDVYSLGAVFYHLICGQPPMPQHMASRSWFGSGIPSIKNPRLTKRERRYCQELLDNIMQRNFLKRWSPSRIRRYISAYLGDSERAMDMARWI